MSSWPEYKFAVQALEKKEASLADGEKKSFGRSRAVYFSAGLKNTEAENVTYTALREGGGKLPQGCGHMVRMRSTLCASTLSICQVTSRRHSYKERWDSSGG